MAKCSCCKNERSPREMVELNLDILESTSFKSKEPILVCPHCDGDALEASKRAVLKRKQAAT